MRGWGGRLVVEMCRTMLGAAGMRWGRRSLCRLYCCDRGSGGDPRRVGVVDSRLYAAEVPLTEEVCVCMKERERERRERELKLSSDKF